MTDDEIQQPLPDNPPDPAEYDEQLIKALDSVVSVRTRIPDDAMTADILGTEREGHGVVINDQGLVLTIGYVVTEANSVWLVDGRGNTLQGHVVAYDQQSGFGLVQALGKLNLPPVVLGKSASLTLGQPMLLAGCGGIEATQQVQVGGIDEFAGYWEYLIDSAIFTVPAHPFWSGAALLGEDAMLYGIGSLILQTVDQDDTVNSANMVIPIDLLPPILNDLLLYGKRNQPARPWVGWFAQESTEGLVISGVSDDGPADRAGLHSGDRIVKVEGQSVETLAELFRAVWSAGEAGVDISVVFERNDITESTLISTIDRNARLKSASIH
jgi:S1-C subfamily serine protease